MRFIPFLLEDWLVRCKGAKIDLDHSGAPAPFAEGFNPCVSGEAWLNEIDIEHKLTKAIAKSYKVKESKIALTTGAQNANFLFLLLHSSPRSPIAMETPSYSPIRAVAEALFAEIQEVKRPRKAGYGVDIRSFNEALYAGAKVGAFTNLHNPSGRKLGDDEIRPLLEKAAEKDALVLFDETFREMSYSKIPSPAFSLGDNAVSTCGLSKLWGLGGLRIGWLIGPEEIAMKVTEARLYSTHHPPVRSTALAIKALEKKEWFRRRAMRLAKGNLAVVKGWAEEERRISITEPDGGFHLLVHLPRGMNDEEFSIGLLDGFKTAVCPGRYFGEEGSIRVTFSCERNELGNGLKNISRMLGSTR